MSTRAAAEIIAASGFTPLAAKHSEAIWRWLDDYITAPHQELGPRRRRLPPT